MAVSSINQVDLQLQDHGYARSLAQFAANLGPVVWRIASKKIRSVLPNGINFGPGWVGKDEILRHTQLPFSQQQNISSTYNRLSSASSSVGLNLAVEDVESGGRLASQSKLTSPSNSYGDVNSMNQADVKYSTGAVGTVMQNMRSPISASYEASVRSEAPGMVSSSYRINQAIPTNYIESTNNLSQGSNGLRPLNSFRPNVPLPEELSWNRPVHQPEYRLDRGHNKAQGSSPLDSNARFLVQGSPSSSLLISSQQPDLGLQL